MKVEAAADLTLSSRPETQRSEAFRSSGDVTPRNLPDTQVDSHPRLHDNDERKRRCAQLAVGGASTTSCVQQDWLPDAASQQLNANQHWWPVMER